MQNDIVFFVFFLFDVSVDMSLSALSMTGTKQRRCQVEARVGRTLVPAIHILQERTNVSTDSCNRDANLLETVRGRWCALLESPMPPEKHECWTSVFNKVVSDEGSGERLASYKRAANTL